MNLHEYQAKQLFSQYNLPVPNGLLIQKLDEISYNIPAKLPGPWVAKCQVHAGGRGKSGGVKLVDNIADIREFAQQWLGQRLVTYQTDALGQPVNTLLIESATAITKELYLGAVIDRSSQRVVIMASTEGGMDIEKVAAQHPEKIHYVKLDPLTGPQAWQGRELAFNLGLTGKLVNQFAKLFLGLSKLFLERDLSLVEINPLVITDNSQLVCLDGKINIDSNALYRQPELLQMRDKAQEDKRESQAAEWELNYVALEGNIGCMVNGAGLAMGTMDTIQHYGGRPANFLDVGGGATRERVSEAFKIILQDPAVKVVLVNIFGGIVRCDLIAEGIISAIAEANIQLPVIVRLAGNHAKEGASKLQQSSLNISAATSLTDAAQQAVSAVEGA